MQEEKKQKQICWLWKKIYGGIFLLGIFVLSAFGPSFEYLLGGESYWGTPVKAEEISDIGEDLSKLAALLISVFTPIVTLEVSMVGILMDNDFVIGKGEIGGDLESVEDIGGFLNHIWRVIRDLVNYAFIVVLLIIAFMTVISAGGEMVGGSSFDVKKILPKFLIAVVLVNFTWFGAKFILDTATVAVHIVSGIPNSIPKSSIPFDEANKEATRKKCIEDFQSKGRSEHFCPFAPIGIKIQGKETLKGETGKKLGFRVCGEEDATEDDCDAVKEKAKDRTIYIFDAGVINVYFIPLERWEEISSGNIAALFAFNVLNIQNLPLSFGGEKSFWDFALKSIVSLIIMIIILAVFTVMFFVLLERVLILWINIILAPIGVLIWVLKGTPLEVSQGEDVLGFSAFLKAAFMPALMMVPLMLGFVMIAVSNSAKNLELDYNMHVTGFNTLIDGIDNLHQFFFYVLAIVALWTSMTVAEKGVKYTSGVVSGIKNGLGGFGKFIASTPLYIPGIPIPKKGGGREQHSLMSLYKIPQKIVSMRETDAHNRASGFFNQKTYMDKINKEARETIRSLNRSLAKEVLEDVGTRRLQLDVAMRNRGVDVSNFENETHADVLRALGEYAGDVRKGEELARESRNGRSFTPNPLKVNVTDSSGNSSVVNFSSVSIADPANISNIADNISRKIGSGNTVRESEILPLLNELKRTGKVDSAITNADVIAELKTKGSIS
jgi:hypothetical protein